MRAKLGSPKAITATAHKLARITHRLITTGQTYDESAFAKDETRSKKHAELRLKAQARALGFQLVPAEIDSSLGVSDSQTWRSEASCPFGKAAWNLNRPT